MTTDEIKRGLKDGSFDSRLDDIYPGDSAGAKERINKALTRFEEIYGKSDSAGIFSAPGRTEVGGNHTDHQRGSVLAASISLDAIAVAAPSGDEHISLYSEGFGEVRLDLSELSVIPDEAGTTSALIRGVAAGLKDRGFNVSGFRAYVTSDVLGGSGLSSSAAFETLVGVIISGLFNDEKIDPVDIAKIGQYAENKYFGKPCGLMDQMACSVGSLCYIDFKDPENPVIEKVEFDMDKAGYSLCITDTKGSHADLTPDYAAAPAEMKAVAGFYGKEVLREVNSEDVMRDISAIREKFGDRAVLRALNFFDESQRAFQEAECLKKNDFEGFLELVTASGDGSFKYLQNVYSNSDVKSQGVSLGLFVSSHVLAGKKGASRVHGGGFAGTIQAFVRNDAVEEYRRALDHVFGEGSCMVMKIRKYGGIRVL